MTTRSDAIVKILPDSCSSAMYDQAARLVDALVALGILKLDEPKIPCDRAIDLMRRKLGMSPSECSNVMILLHANGFRIVEQ